MATSPPEATSSKGVLLSYLPAVFHGPRDEDHLLGDFLAPFEEILFGQEGLHSTIASLAHRLDALTAPNEFLPWLASWMGAALYRQLPNDKQREFVANASDYYRFRGTSHNLKRLLELFTCLAAEIEEPDYPPFQIGVGSPIGLHSHIGGGPPHTFRVRLTIPVHPDKSEVQKFALVEHVERLARAVIDLEKPAHTAYELKVSIAGEAPTVGDAACPPAS
jgi:phage tail-like protein